MADDQQSDEPKNNNQATKPTASKTGTLIPITIIVVGIFAAWYAGNSRFFVSPANILLKRPPHKIPAATWHQTSRADVVGPLTAKQVRAYTEDGFLILPHFFEDFLPSLQSDVEGLIDGLADELYATGRVRSTYANESWTKRLLKLTKDYPDAPMVLIKGGILPRNFQRLFQDARMLDVANQLGVGPSVAVSAAWNLRAKMKKHEETTVPWHQDNSYWEPRIWDEHVLTVWVALVDANVDNGCMQFIRGGHKSGKTARHTIGSTTRTWYTETSVEDLTKDLFGEGDNASDHIFTAQVPAGTAILFPGTTPHRSLNSVTDDIRWSTDYRLHRGVSASRPGKTPLDWFYGLKDSLLLRDGSADNDHVPDWSTWAKQERTKLQDHGLGADAPPFDPVIVGPWMDLWDIVEHEDGLGNPHVDRYMATDAANRSGGEGYLPDKW